MKKGCSFGFIISLAICLLFGMCSVGSEENTTVTSSSPDTDTSITVAKTANDEPTNIPHDNISENTTKQISEATVEHSPKIAADPIEEPTNIPADEAMVWIPTKGGIKYHTHSGCSNMDGPEQTTQSNAIARGFTPCKRCH